MQNKWSYVWIYVNLSSEILEVKQLLGSPNSFSHWCYKWSRGTQTRPQKSAYYSSYVMSFQLNFWVLAVRDPVINRKGDFFSFPGSETSSTAQYFLKAVCVGMLSFPLFSTLRLSTVLSSSPRVSCPAPLNSPSLLLSAQLKLLYAWKLPTLLFL